jgi:DNA repair protein RadD
LNLRPYQHQAISDLRLAYRSGTRSALLVLPTGGGKTVIFSYVTENAVARGGKVLVLVHRRELIHQTSAQLRDLGVQHGVISAGFPATDAPVQVASVQTIVRRLHKQNWQPTLIIIDEAHHAVAGSWKKILDHFSGASLLGVTATPMRLDGRGLGDWFQNMILGPSVSSLVAMRYLAPVRCYTLPKKLDWKSIKKSGGEFVASDAADLLEEGEFNGDAVKEYIKHCPGKPAIVFCCTIAHSQLIADLFTKAGYRAAHLSGDTDPVTRKQLIDDLGNGNLDVLTNCMVISEGTDIPVVTAAILLRPTTSTALYLQQVGRALRPAPGKDKAIIIDCVGNILRHGLPDADREYSLDDKPKSEAAPLVKECPVCFAALPITATICPSCGHVFTPAAQESKPKPISVSLVEIKKSQAAEQRNKRRRIASARTREELEAIAKDYGYKPGWVHVMLKQREPMRRAASQAKGLNWTEILRNANIPEPPGYREAVDRVSDAS